jgi:hypothetical protein
MGLALAGGCGGTSAPPAAAPAASATAVAGDDLMARVRAGDHAAITEVHTALAPKADETVPAGLNDAEAVELVELAEALRAGYVRMAAGDRLQTLEVLGRGFERFGAKGTPAGWSKLLSPAFDILSAGLADREAAVRHVALRQLGRLWSWSPDRTMTPAEETTLAEWKERLYPQTLERLRERDVAVRVAAIDCLGKLPIDGKAAPALNGLRDKEFTVRLQTLTVFADRPGILTEDALLPLLNDAVPDLRTLAEKILAARGLSPELIGLGRLVTHPEARIRASAIPEIVKNGAIDPIVWLLQLTEDADPDVRLSAVEALEGRITPEVRQRLREMAVADDSAAVRSAADKLAPVDTTAALPPLPGTSSLNPRAN